MIEINLDAAKRISELIKPGEALRIGIRGGGCSGFEYQLAVGAGSERSVEISGVPVVIDPQAERFLEQARLTWEDGGDFAASGFKFENPGYASCGCGKSFGG